jgi:phenylacetate-CoA ligase
VWARYFDEQIETMPAAWTRRLEEDLLAEQVTRCFERAPFYSRKLIAAGIRPEHVATLEDLQLLPLTTRDELRAAQTAAPPFGDFVCADQLDIARVHVSSDTTGRPLLVGFTEDDLRASAEIGARALWACGARPDDVVLQCVSERYPAGTLSVQAALEATGATTIPVGVRDTPGLLGLWHDLQPTALAGTSSEALEVGESAREAGVEPRSLGLRKLLIAAERGSEHDVTRERLEDIWGAEVGGFFGVPDVWGTLAGECEEHEGFHLCGQGGTLVELVDPASGKPVEIEPGANGELVFTHLDREASPLLRLRSGEAASVVAVECACGRTGARLSLAGRTA